MRRLLGSGALVVALIVLLPFAGFLTARNVSTPECVDAGISRPITGPMSPVRDLSQDQVRLAKIIWARAQANAPRLGGRADQAAVIAIAVASQESDLGANPAIVRPNADGDAGPFQQRTLPGWYGTLAQVTDPTYAANTFLLGHTVTAEQHAEAVAASVRPAGPAGYHIPGLANVHDWEHLDIIEAAHQVQRSAFPDAVADDIPIARELVSAFGIGAEPEPPTDGSGTDCVRPPAPTHCPPTGSPAEARLRPDALLVLRCVKQQFPKINAFHGYRPHDPFTDHPSGRAVDVMINSAYSDIDSRPAIAYGTKIANWIQDHHAELGVDYIIWRQRIWSVERQREGWRPMADRGNPTANHLDHVHVTTYGNAAKPPNAPPADVAGPAVTPVENYTIAATFGQVGSWARYHTGLDFAAPIGTPVRAAMSGRVTHAGAGPASSWAGEYVAIKHNDGTSTLYAHFSSTDVQDGQRVTTGQTIGDIGMTGRSFGPHLHFEAYPAGIVPGNVYGAVDPANWLALRGADIRS